MLFNIKRFYHGVIQRQKWLLLIFILPFLYFIISAVIPDQFTVSQDIKISGELPVIVSNPLDIKQVKDLVINSDILTLNSFSLKKLMGALSDSESSTISISKLSALMDNQSKLLKERVRNGISMIETGENRVSMTYTGNDLQLGKILVHFYSGRLVQKTLEGIRSGNHSYPRTPQPGLSGSLNIAEESALWRSERSSSMGLMFLISIFCIMILIGVLEWNDNSFKSERQIGRYLDIPVLGSIPDLNKMSKLIGMES